jgi:transcriptional regulator with XRE-family HTH domain
MQTIGERLEEARKRKGISIREAAEVTKIRGDYLQKFENNQFDINLSDIYVRGFLRTYANFLKLPADRILSDFKALGIAAESRPKTPSREVYGRMDLSFASSSGSAKAKDDLPPPSPLDDGGGEKSPSGRTFARIGTSLPTGTFIDQRILMKAGAAVLAVVVIGLAIWGIKSSVTSGTPARQVTQVEEPSITLVAIDSVQVKVTQDSDGAVLYSGTLVRGETRTLPKRGSILIVYNPGRNLMVEYKGKRHPMPDAGESRARLP